MTLIQEAFEVHAPPEQVFDLINDVETTSDYSEFIQGVETIGEDTYRYKVSVAGIPIGWDAKITERIWPNRICWKSLRGIELKGSFELTEVDFGSNVLFQMDYHIHNRILALILEPLLLPLIRKFATEAFKQLKTRIS
jgi:uncharacterized membrane protein